ncbi:MAG: LysR family transcriptional regulator, partial [Paracoccaceae bacterium]
MSYLENVRTFVRVYELGSMSAAGRDLRISPAVTSSRISQLEGHLGIRLFQRTTRNLTPTEQGKAFYRGSVDILEAVENA